MGRVYWDESLRAVESEHVQYCLSSADLIPVHDAD